MGEELGPEAWKPHSQLPRSWPPAPPSSPGGWPFCSRLPLAPLAPDSSPTGSPQHGWQLPPPPASEAVSALHAASPLGCAV